MNDSLPYENLLGIPQPICNDNMRSFTVLETVVLRNAAVVGFTSSSVYSSGIFAANSPIGWGTGKIYVPENLITSYQSAAGWSTYAACFTAIEGSEFEL